MMDLDQLQSVRDRERQTDRLQQLRDSFYAEAAELVADLRERRQQAAAEADDPFSDPAVARSSDRLQTAEQTVEAIYEKRVGKIVTAATFAAADMPADVEGMTAEERDLFEALVTDIRTNRRRVLDPLDPEASDSEGETTREPTAGGPSGSDAPRGSPPEGDATTGPAADPDQAPDEGPDGGTEPATGTDDDDGREPPPDVRDEEATPPPERDPDSDDEDAAAVERGEPQADGAGTAVGDDGGQSRAGSAPAAAASVPRTRVRITADVGEIFGVDEREYHLESGDVVTLPTANADPLLDRDAAERVE